jgi:dienelactone hydrolase
MPDISYTVGGRGYTGYLANGAGAKPAPGILVLHEATGLGPQARGKTDRLAELGYVAFAADLFGEPVQSMEHAGSLVRQITEDWSVLRGRCSAALELLCRQPGVDTRRLAAIGFCFGGLAALELARSGAELRAIVGFHSALHNGNLEDSRKIKAKVLMCLGDSDPVVKREARDIFADNMTASGVDSQLLLFSGVAHSFTNPAADMPGFKYDARAERRSWTAMQNLFAEAFAD